MIISLEYLRYYRARLFKALRTTVNFPNGATAGFILTCLCIWQARRLYLGIKNMHGSWHGQARLLPNAIRPTPIRGPQGRSALVAVR